jgi:tetratricopeptide (TPR) repeat protein
MTSGSVPDGIPSGSEYDWYQRACGLLESGNCSAAAILFQRLRDVDSNPSILEGLGRALFDAKRYEEAVEVLDELVENTPDDDYAHFLLGLSLWRLQKFVLARDHLAMAFVMKPHRSEYGTALTQVKSTLRHRMEQGMPLAGPIAGQGDL